MSFPSRGTDHKDPPGAGGTRARIFFRMLQEVDDLGHLLTGGVIAGNVGEPH